MCAGVGGVEAETLVDVVVSCVDLVEIVVGLPVVVGLVVLGLVGGLLVFSVCGNQDESKDQSSKKKQGLRL